MDLELKNVIRLPNDLQSRILEEASKKEQLSEIAANTLILEAVQKHLPQTTNTYITDQPFSTFEHLLTMAITQLDQKRSYAFTGLFVNDDNTTAYNELCALQTRLNHATIVKTETIIMIPNPPHVVSFAAPTKEAPDIVKSRSDLAANLHAAFKKRIPLDVETIEEKLEIAKKEREANPVDAETLSELRLKHQLKKAPKESQDETVREQYPVYAHHLQNLRTAAHQKILPSIQEDDAEAESRKQKPEPKSLNNCGLRYYLPRFMRGIQLKNNKCICA